MAEIWNNTPTPTPAPLNAPPKPAITVPANYKLELVANQWTLVHTPPPLDVVASGANGGSNTFFLELSYIRRILSCDPGYSSVGNLAMREGFAKKLWDVLTALRGPDGPNVPYGVKQATTAVIRNVLMGPASFSSNCGGDMTPDTPTLKARRAELSARNSYAGVAVSIHFINHARKAFEALGIEW